MRDRDPGPCDYDNETKENDVGETGVTFWCLLRGRIVGYPEVRVWWWGTIRTVSKLFGVWFTPFDVVVQPVDILRINSTCGCPRDLTS